MISKLMTALAVLVIGLSPFTGSALADEVTINTLPLTRQIYMLTGQGGNQGGRWRGDRKDASEIDAGNGFRLDK
jgi:hypothetical protein